MKRWFSLLLVLPASASAHPASHADPGILHLFTEPDHLALLALAVAVIAMIATGRRVLR